MKISFRVSSPFEGEGITLQGIFMLSSDRCNWRRALLYNGSMVKKHSSISPRQFENLVGCALRSLPAEFQAHMENVAIIIEDEPPPGMERDTLGLYEGVPLSQRGVEEPVMPDRIILFRKSIERVCSTPEEIEHEIRETVLHEVGHFFGLDEGDLR